MAVAIKVVGGGLCNFLNCRGLLSGFSGAQVNVQEVKSNSTRFKLQVVNVEVCADTTIPDAQRPIVPHLKTLRGRGTFIAYCCARGEFIGAAKVVFHSTLVVWLFFSVD